VQELVREADVQIYAVGIFSSFATRETFYGPSLLSALAEPTGGHTFVASPEQLQDIATKIGVELHNQYLITYRPAGHTRDGKYRKIGVTLDQPPGLPKLIAHWRTGYYSPPE